MRNDESHPTAKRRDEEMQSNEMTGEIRTSGFRNWFLRILYVQIISGKLISTSETTF